MTKANPGTKIRELGRGRVDQSKDGRHALKTSIHLAAKAVDQCQHGAGAAHAQVVAKRLRHRDRLLGQALRQLDLAG